MPDIWSFAAVVTKTLMYFGILTSSGLVLTRFVFAAEISSVLPVMRKSSLLCALLGVVAALASFCLSGAALTGDMSGLTDPDMLGLLWQTQVGTALQMRLVGGVLMLTGLLLGGSGWGLAGLGALTALWSFTQIGHLSEGQDLWPKLLLMAHLSAIAFWIGILLPLNRLARNPGELARAGQLGHRFGQIATVVIPVLLLAGIALGWLLVGSWGNLFTTAYGLDLIVKLVLVAVLLALGAWNKLRIVPDMISGNPKAAAKLSQTMFVEWLFFIAVLLATASLTLLFALPDNH
ncbi:copper-binding protein [Roseovarius faecimaris]|uniref:Copper-binding protein n=1 Tax=Roseovarius faecimaris TaxID=2494550 RepID=A0A6I6IXW2_9RHOB|nr:CopD family protein [Roseovarius faecimaris]QGX97488.1 copper-binding protein [Roseovarius faecimaris]